MRLFGICTKLAKTWGISLCATRTYCTYETSVFQAFLIAFIYGMKIIIESIGSVWFVQPDGLVKIWLVKTIWVCLVWLDPKHGVFGSVLISNSNPYRRNCTLLTFEHSYHWSRHFLYRLSFDNHRVDSAVSIAT